MNSQKLNRLRLCLGLTHNEIKRRIDLGLIDLHVLNIQIDHYSSELKQESSIEKWLELKSLDQVDKFKAAE